MLKNPSEKYRPYKPVNLNDRTWPNRVIEKTPIWCSVDLRDGNQALINPMNHERKMRFYELLCKLGFKQIEAGFPSASQTDFDFIRHLIDGNHIAEDTTISLLTQARAELIKRSFEAVEGAREVIIHQYNSTSEVQRRLVFGIDRKGIIDIAVNGMLLIRELAEKYKNKTNVIYEYTAESFPGTELDFALEICNQVIDAMEPTPEKKMIINLPETVQMSTPNIHADQIEWMSRNLARRDSVILSVHTHNDRGTGVAAAELALMAGAERVEGTLFGNGERTGNVDLVTLALNMYTQGIDPGLDLSDIDGIRSVVEYCNQLPVHERHPYGGDLVFTAFSGSHQDAIKKGLAARKKSESDLWEVPYLPIDPSDLGRSYEAVIRINSQSGKGGIAYIMEADYGLHLPKAFQRQFSKEVQQLTDKDGCELTPEQIFSHFNKIYIYQTEQRLKFVKYYDISSSSDEDDTCIEVTITDNGVTQQLTGEGSGPIGAFVAALSNYLDLKIEVLDYSEHALGAGANASAVAYLRVQTTQRNEEVGVGIDNNIVQASLAAVVSAVNRVL